MARRFSFTFLVIRSVQLVLIAEKSNCYVVNPRNSRGHARGKLYHCLSASKNIEDNVTPKKISGPACPRYPDYPSFAYDDFLDYRRRNTRKISIDAKRKRGTNSDELSSLESALTDAITPSSGLGPNSFLPSVVRDANRRTRLLNRRSYTAREPFEQENIMEPPCLQVSVLENENECSCNN